MHMSRPQSGIAGYRKHNMGTYIPIIGLEVHVELNTESKMFCGCKNDPFHAEQPNIYTCPVCLGMPGGLPVPNKKAVDWTILLGLALGCEISLFSKFDRKHYFYPDLAKGYQISQYDQPLCTNGKLQTEFGLVRIRRVHLEEDTGKLLHTTLEGRDVSLVDFNRSGVPLVEIVTEPDIHSAEQAKAFGKKLQQIVRALKISQADMEKGSMRLEANISLSENAEVIPKYKVEAKNINSFRFMEQAISFEIDRQGVMLKKGEIPAQETRGWSEAKKQTIVQRTKEDAEDYRYFPEPDIPPMQFTSEHIDAIRLLLPEMPEDRQKRLMELGIKQNDAAALSLLDAGTIDEIIRSARKKDISPEKVASVIVNKKLDLDSLSIEHVLQHIADQYSTDQISDVELEKAVQAVLKKNEKAVADLKAGKQQVIGFLIGMVMKELGKKVDPKLIQEEIRKTIEAH
jgi:aspartyl-tRNA(Asn)/glutamyl-tRNA(Gln) amidotransferase subunit B